MWAIWRANFHAFIIEITQRFCTNSTPLLWEIQRKKISTVWKPEATQATQACKQRLWLPLWLSVSLATLLIHLKHNRQWTHAIILSLKTFDFLRLLLHSHDFEVKLLKSGKILMRKHETISGSLWLGSGLCHFSRCLLPHSSFLSLACITLTKALHTHIHPLQCDRQGDKMAE